MKNRIRKIQIVLLSLIISFQANGQSSEIEESSQQMITLADIWTNRTFSGETVRGLKSMNDGLHYTVLERSENGNILSKYRYKDGKKVETILESASLDFQGKKLQIDDYEFSADEKKILIATEIESIYRRSSNAFFYVVELESMKVLDLSSKSKQMYADFSPSGEKVAYVQDNNLFYKDFGTGEEVQITDDGENNKIINGASDWVYEEELELSQAFQWSPDGNKIAFYRFNETAVKQWNMKIYDSLYPTDYRFKYPKAGEENSAVAIKIYNIVNKQILSANLTTEYEYLTSIKWTKDANQLAVMSSNRHQNELKINLVDANNGDGKVIYTEESDTYIEMPFDVHFLEDDKSFIILSEKDGFRHLYMYALDGQLKKQLTKGNWPVTEFYGVDFKNAKVYFQSAETSPMDRNVYSINLKGEKKKRISKREGTNRGVFSKSFSYFINYNTTANSPSYITLNLSSGKEVRVLKDNEELKEKLKGFQLSEKEFFSFKTTEGIELNAWMIKPVDFDKSKEYPVFLTIYGGPGSQTVTNSWGGSNFFWHQMLAQKGYIVVSVDNRGTGGRGVEFKKCTYKQLGKYETIDQIEAAKYFSSLPYVDAKRIGVQGWSYGGYMSSLCILKGAEHFKTAIAVAPVTNWRFYDSIYTERYMQTPQENESGYDDNSPINHVDKLKGNYLLVHGMADDNVHLQNTTEMISALVDANKQFDLFMYPDKNHGIYGGNTRYHLYTMMTNFIESNL